jgi:periplasmic protein TonB
MNPHTRWCDGIARNLIWLAARKAPPALTERLGEEWLADLTARSGAFSQLRFALGCCWATTVITHEFGASVRPAAAAVAATRTTVVDHAGLGPSFSRRTTVILLIVGLHVLVICVLAAGIEAPKLLKANPPRIEVSFLPKPAPPAPQIPVHPTLSLVGIHRPTPPEPAMPTEPTVTRGQVTEAPPMRPADPPSSRPVNRVLGGPGVGFPNTDDFYPDASRRLGEKGTTTVNVCVDGAGRVIGKPTIDQSSGSARLDEGALRLARAGSGHYRTTTEDGHPVSACYPFRVRFQLRD